MKTFFLVGLIGVLSTHAEFIVAPNERATQAGNAFVFNGFDRPSTFQNVYGSGNFSQPALIHGLAFRLDEGAGGSFDAVIPRVRIRLSTYSGSFASFNPNQFAYESNKGSDDLTVYDGAVHWISMDPPGATPNAFDLSIHFSRPFAYDPAKGPLLVNYESFGPFSGGVIVDSHGHGDMTIGWAGGNDLANLVTQFEVTAIPEPATLALLAVALSGALMRRKHKA